MIETNWLNCTDPEEMISFLRSRLTHRKVSLFMCACFRRLGDLLTEGRGLALVDAIERQVDGVVTAEESQHWVDAVIASSGTEADSLVAWAAMSRGWRQAKEALRKLAMTEGKRTPLAEVLRRQSMLLRDISGNPFRPMPSVDQSWLTLRVRSLATAIYEESAFDRLPRLADVLQDAGCDNADLIAHCRRPSEHVRGCWVLDLILGKESMTESAWLNCSDPTTMLDHLISSGKASDRKLWLFGVACSRFFYQSADTGLQRALKDCGLMTFQDVAERFADGQASKEEMLAAATSDEDDDAVLFARSALYLPQIACLASRALAGTKPTDCAPLPRAEAFRECGLLRDIFNPFLPSRMEMPRFDCNVLSLANRLYDERAFGRMRELAHALENAGCLDECVLKHCRSETEHVRRCWVLDMLLGKG